MGRKIRERKGEEGHSRERRTGRRKRELGGPCHLAGLALSAPPTPAPQTHTEGRSAQPEETGCCDGVGVRAPERLARPGVPFFRRQAP